MPEFFLELFAEEIPARLQKKAAENLAKLVSGALSPLNPPIPREFYGPRRLAVSVDLAVEVPPAQSVERGPRINAPEQALSGFLRKHDAIRDQLVEAGGFWVLHKKSPAIPTRQLILGALPEALTRLPWPKSMRWGSGGDFNWVRPLRRIVCLFDGEVVPIKLGPIMASDETEGHRVHAPGAFSVLSCDDWKTKLKTHYVIADQADRENLIGSKLLPQISEKGCAIVDDYDLIEEVTGLVEWPVPLIGRIDEKFMDLPPEVRELSMKTNQKYFALRDGQGRPAPYFAFVANLEAPDGGAAIIAGNERVLRARLSDARHFWDLDLKTPLDALLPELEKITFHAKLGTQRQRADRIAARASAIALELGADAYHAAQARWAGLLCKADLVTGMVGEFPELQGVMGGYYAAQKTGDWDGASVGPAIGSHYQPKGPSDAVPTVIVAISVALADKIDTLVEFFKIGEKPTGSGDPYALRRAALGVIRIILENDLRLALKPLLGGDVALFEFIIERLRVKLRGDGKRFDVLDAVLAAGSDDDLVRLMKRVEALSDMLGTEDGKNLLAAYKRAANILKIEDAKDGPHHGKVERKSFAQAEEDELWIAIGDTSNMFDTGFEGQPSPIKTEQYDVAMRFLASLRPAIDAFFDNVTVNTEPPELRRNRLRLLTRFRDTVHQIADFSKLEG